MSHMKNVYVQMDLETIDGPMYNPCGTPQDKGEDKRL